MLSFLFIHIVLMHLGVRLSQVISVSHFCVILLIKRPFVHESCKCKISETFNPALYLWTARPDPHSGTYTFSVFPINHLFQQPSDPHIQYYAPLLVPCWIEIKRLSLTVPAVNRGMHQDVKCFPLIMTRLLGL